MFYSFTFTKTIQTDTKSVCFGLHMKFGENQVEKGYPEANRNLFTIFERCANTRIKETEQILIANELCIALIFDTETSCK